MGEAGSPTPAGLVSPHPTDTSCAPAWHLLAHLLFPTGLFGTGIQSYFTFLRFLLLLNLLTLLLNSTFILLPLVWRHPPDPGPALNFSECLARAEGDSAPQRT